MPRTISRTTRRAPRKRPRPNRAAAVTASVAYEDWLIERLKNPEEAAAYLEAAIDQADQGVLMLALRQVAQAQGGVAAIARRAKLTREATYRILSLGGNPELRSFKALLAATGLRLAVRPAARHGKRVRAA